MGAPGSAVFAFGWLHLFCGSLLFFVGNRARLFTFPCVEEGLCQIRGIIKRVGFRPLMMGTKTSAALRKS